MTDTLHLRSPTCRPPFAFVHAASNSTAAFSPRPQLAPPPVIGPTTPSLTSHSCAAADRLARQDPTSSAANAAVRRLLLRRTVVLIGSSRLYLSISLSVPRCPRSCRHPLPGPRR